MAEVPHIEVDEETKEAIKEVLSQMQNPVEVEFFTSANCAGRETNWCVPTEELLDLLAELAPNGLIKLAKYKYEESKQVFEERGIDPNRVPVIHILGGAIRYWGAPLGEEVRALVETFARIGSGKSGLRPRTRQTLEQLRNAQNAKRVYVATVVTPSCPYCPYSVLMSNMFAFETGGKVISLTIEAYENEDIAEYHGITGTPTTIMWSEGQSWREANVEFVGVPPEHELAKKVLSYAGLE